MTTATEQISSALDGLTPKTWRKGSPYDRDTGQRCLIGALANLDAWVSTDVASTLCAASLPVVARVIREQYPDCFVCCCGCGAGRALAEDNEASVVVFNDHKNTTIHDVRAVLEKALVLSEEEL